MGDALDDCEQYMEDLVFTGYSMDEAMSVVEGGHGPVEFSLTPNQLNEGIKMRVKHCHESRLEACKFILVLNEEHLRTRLHLQDKYNPFKIALTVFDKVNSIDCHHVIGFANKIIEEQEKKRYLGSHNHNSSSSNSNGTEQNRRRRLNA